MAVQLCGEQFETVEDHRGLMVQLAYATLKKIKEKVSKGR